MKEETNLMNALNFIWLLDHKLAGHEGPSGEEDLMWLRRQSVLALVRLIEREKTEVDTNQIRKLGMWDYHEPIPDFAVPKPEQIERIIRFIDASISAGRPVGVSYKFGLGRTGIIRACYLVRHGLDANVAIDEVRKKRPGSIETKEQENVVKREQDTCH